MPGTATTNPAIHKDLGYFAFWLTILSEKSLILIPFPGTWNSYLNN